MKFEKDCTNRASKKALLEVYVVTEVFGFEFPYEPPERRDYDRDSNYPEELECAGLEWIKERGIITRDITLKIPYSHYNSSKNDHLPELIYPRCLLRRGRNAEAAMRES